jgi:hypothetical protein
MNELDAILNPEKAVAFYPKLARLTGSIKAAIFLSQLCSWGKENAEGWVRKTADEIEKATFLTRREQELVRKTLKEKGFITEGLTGLPACLTFRANLSTISKETVR